MEVLYTDVFCKAKSQVVDNFFMNIFPSLRIFVDKKFWNQKNYDYFLTAMLAGAVLQSCLLDFKV